MIAATGSWTNTKDTDRSEDLSVHFSVNSPDLFRPYMQNSLTSICNTVHRSPPTAPALIASIPSLTRSLFTMHFDHVATADRHDMDAWASELDAVAILSSLDNPSAFNVATGSSALMELQPGRPRTIGQSSNADRLCEDMAVHLRGWTSLVAPCLGVSLVRPNVMTNPYLCEHPSWGRREVGEILLRCGVFEDSQMSTIEPVTARCICGHNIDARPVISPMTHNVTIEPGYDEDERLITALADWTSDWVHALVIQPYRQGTFRFQYRGSPSRASASVALRIRQVLDHVENPVQVAVHSLFFISTLTMNNAHESVLFLSVPIFQYFHNNGVFIAEDFMFRTFVTCAMIGDKTVNDVTLTTNTWNHLTRIPQVILNATEKYTLSCLEWNVVMTPTQWQDTIIYLRSSIKMGSAFDPFSYNENSPSSIMARYLDGLVNLSHASTSQKELPAVEILSPQPIRHFTHWEVFSTAEWCPEDDPVVNEKPRTIGIAPGPHQTPKVGTTAKDLLDSILGSRSARHLTYLAQPAGISFCGSFGAIGARLAHSISIASACQSAWVPSHG